MTLIDEIKTSNQESLKKAWELFTAEMQSEENAEYRRGFFAGMLCARLTLKGDICEFETEFDRKMLIKE